MAIDVNKPIDQAVSDFDGIKDELESMDIEVGNIPTEEYPDKINEIPVFVAPRSVIRAIAGETLHEDNWVTFGDKAPIYYETPPIIRTGQVYNPFKPVGENKDIYIGYYTVNYWMGMRNQTTGKTDSINVANIIKKGYSTYSAFPQVTSFYTYNDKIYFHSCGQQQKTYNGARVLINVFGECTINEDLEVTPVWIKDLGAPLDLGDYEAASIFGLSGITFNEKTGKFNIIDIVRQSGFKSGLYIYTLDTSGNLENCVKYYDNEFEDIVPDTIYNGAIENDDYLVISAGYKGCVVCFNKNTQTAIWKSNKTLANFTGNYCYRRYFSQGIFLDKTHLAYSEVRSSSNTNIYFVNLDLTTLTYTNSVFLVTEFLTEGSGQAQLDKDTAIAITMPRQSSEAIKFYTIDLKTFKTTKVKELVSSDTAYNTGGYFALNGGNKLEAYSVGTTKNGFVFAMGSKVYTIHNLKDTQHIGTVDQNALAGDSVTVRVWTEGADK